MIKMTSFGDPQHQESAKILQFRAIGRGGGSATGASAPLKRRKGPLNVRVTVKMTHRVQEMWTSTT